jgi:8-oxo-dGTP pyrophosphatase MutT (NUDIX family)
MDRSSPDPDHVEVVRAAGGVVWRPTPGGPTPAEVLLVHRPRYDDWSLPKGKLDPGETDEAAAVREVAEETGVHGALGDDLGEVRYVDGRGRPKVVRWWAIRADAAGAPASAAEVDEVRWVDLDTAEATVDFVTDREVLARFRLALARAAQEPAPAAGSGEVPGDTV